MWLLLCITSGKAIYIMGYGESLFYDFWAHINRLFHYENVYSNVNDAEASLYIFS